MDRTYRIVVGVDGSPGGRLAQSWVVVIPLPAADRERKDVAVAP